MRRLVHLITPGDHFSPRTGSAIPTVVHGLSSHRPAGAPRPAVLVSSGTYPERYDSADIIEYPLPTPPHVLPGPLQRYGDPMLGLGGLPRPIARRPLRSAVDAYPDWRTGVLLAHNNPQAIPLVPDARARVLYAHNRLFRTYSKHEAGKVLGAASAVVCVSAFLAEDTATQLPRSIAQRIAVVRNGVDTQLFRRPRPLTRGDRLRVLFVGRMIWEKGPDVVVRALSMLGRSDIELTLVGSAGFDANAPLTSFELDLRRLSTGVAGGVRTLPFSERETIAALMAEADVVVVPSRWPEPFALTALEGMAAGAAVVASDTGGVRESVAGVGMLVPPDDAAALAEAIEALADDDDVLARTAAAGRAYAEANDWARAAERLDEVVTAALA